MASRDQTYQEIVEAASDCLLETGMVPEVRELVRKIGIPRRIFYRYFRDKNELIEDTIEAVDDIYHALLDHTAESARPVQQRIQDFLMFRVMYRVRHAPISRPCDLEDIHQYRIGQTLRGLLREAWAGRNLPFSTVDRAAKKIIEDNDRLIDDLCSQLRDDIHFEHEDNDGHDTVELSDEGERLLHRFFNPPWAVVSDLLSSGPVTIDSSGLPT